MEYVLKYDFIVAELCENRSVKSSGCDGKCYLRKKLASTSEQDHSTSSSLEKKISSNIEILFFNDFIFNWPQCFFVVKKVLISIFYQNFYKHMLPFSLLKPPLF